MAKRKLSPEQRTEIRSDIKTAIESGQKQADVLRDVAKKYGISTVTAGWYLRAIRAKDTEKKPKDGRRRRGKGRKGMIKDIAPKSELKIRVVTIAFCPFCGEKIPNAVIIQGKKPIVVPVDIRYCSHCGDRLPNAITK